MKAIVAATVLAASLCFSLFGCTQSVDSGGVVSLLDAAVARLQTIPMPQISVAPNGWTKALPDRIEIRKALRTGDASALRAILIPAHRQFEQGELSENSLYRALEPLYAELPEALPALDRWVAESPREYVARLSRGLVRLKLGWVARGQERVRDTPELNFREMARWHQLAAEDFLASLDLSTRPTPSVAGLIEIAKAESKHKQADALFQQGVRLLPNSSGVHLAYIPLLYLEWGRKTIRDAEAFLHEAEKRGVEKEVLSSLKRHLYNANHDNILDHDQRVALAFAIAYSMEHDTYDAWIWREKAERNQGLLVEAQKSLEHAAQVTTDTSQLYEERGWVFELRGMLAKAVADYERAAYLEANWAQEKLIYAYLNGGLGLPKDLTKARALCEESAAMHNWAGERCLARLYREGLAGLPIDPPESVKWEWKAAHHGDAAAANNLGWALVKGLGVPADRKEGVFWLRQAARKDDKMALQTLRGLGESTDDLHWYPGTFDIMQRWVMRAREKWSPGLGDDSSKTRGVPSL